jgi:hypothetical protein
MRNSVKFIFLWFCFFNCSSVKLKAEGITDYEKQWKILGPVNFIDSLSGAYQFSQLDKELFFLENYQVLEMNRKEFWSAVKHKSELDFTQSLLGNHRKQYTDMFGKYIFERNSKSVEFTKLQDQFHMLTTSTSSGFGLDTLNSICTNPNFEDAGSFHFKGWNAWAGNACYYTNNYSCNNFSTQIFPNLTDNLQLQPYAGMPVFDSIVGFNRLPTVAPGGNYSMRLENMDIGGQASKLTYSFTVDAEHSLYAAIFALVLEEPNFGHVNEERPYFEIKVFDSTLNKQIDCLGYRVVADSKDPYFGSSKFLKVSPNSEIKFTNWDSLVMDLSGQIGHYVSVTYVVSDCALGGHLGYAYIDGACLNQSFDLGACNDGKRTLKLNNSMSNIYWTGPGIVGSNYGKEILVNKPGKYVALANNNSQRCLYKYPYVITDTTCVNSPPPPCNLNFNELNIGSCQDSSNLFDIQFKISGSNYQNAKVLGYSFDKIFYSINLPHQDSSTIKIQNIYADGRKHVLKAAVFAGNYFSNFNSFCYVTDTITAPSPCYHPLNTDCKECLGTFAPDTGKIYVLSAWVSQGSTTDTTRTLNFPYVQVEYLGTGVTNPPKFKGSGKIIDGWQRIYEEFKIPTSATQLTVKLGSESGDSYFDDIRIYPLKGSLKSYVYDPVSLRLLAELDENNYATFYEYDQEGILVRTKKETERGIITISENRQSNPKK